MSWAQDTVFAQNYHNSCNALMLGVHDDWSVLPNHTFVATVHNVVCYDNDVGSIVGFARMRAPVAGLARVGSGRTKDCMFWALMPASAVGGAVSTGKG